MKTQILVTGSAGFIGSHVTKELLRRGYSVVGVDSFSDYYSTQLKQLRIEQFNSEKNFRFEQINIANLSEVEKVCLSSNFDGVIHLAAQAGVRLSLQQSSRYIESNITGFYNILRKSIELNIPKFVYASSSSVYGDLSPLPYSESSKIMSPKSFYGTTKLNNEQSAQILTSKSQTSTRGLRYFTVYGPWGRPDMAYFRLMAAALGKHHFTMFGDGSVQRDFTYIEDVVQTTVDLFENMSSTGKTSNDIVNIGGHRPLSMNYLIKLIQEISGCNFKIEKEEQNPNDSQKTVADNSYLTSLLGERKFTSLEVGIENFYSWMQRKEIISNVENWIKSST